MRECYSKAKAFWAEGDFGRAMIEFMKNIVLSINKEGVLTYEDEFAALLQDAAAAGIMLHDPKRRIPNEFFRNSWKISSAVGDALRKINTEGATVLYKKAYNLCGGAVKIRLHSKILNVRSYVFDQWHIQMINDKERNEAYDRAMSRVIDLKHLYVVDIGTGTGLLAMMASSYISHDSPMFALEGQPATAAMAKRILEKNDMDRYVALVTTMSENYKPSHRPTQPNVVVTETMDSGGLGEKILEIALDSHQKWSDGQRRYTFIPAKLTFYVVLAESDVFWKTRNYEHNCSNLKCPKECGFREHGNVIVTEQREEENCLPNYENLNPEDFPGLNIFTRPVEIFSVDLNDREQLEKLKQADVTKGSFEIPIEISGRGDIMLLYWKATLAEGVELVSVRKGGWDYAAVTVAERSIFCRGAAFEGQFAINFTKGICLWQKELNRMPNDIPVPILSHADKPNEDGAIELANNRSLKEYFSKLPSRFTYWVAEGESDPYFPITTQGVLKNGYWEKMKEARKKKVLPHFDTIRKIRCVGALFAHDRVNNAARQDPTKHRADIDLSIVDEVPMIEYREMRWFSKEQKVEFARDSFTLFELDTSSEMGEEGVRQGEIQRRIMECDTVSDGVVYWWEFNGGEWSSMEGGLPLAACLWEKRETMEKGEEVALRGYLVDGEVMVIKGEEKILSLEDPFPVLPLEDEVMPVAESEP